MAKVLFIEKKLRTDKLGILYLSAILKQAGHAVDMIQDDVDNAEHYINAYNPDFLAYSVMSGDHNWFIKRNQHLIGLYPDIRSIMGGPHFTFFPEDAIEDDAIDFAVIGPGENVINDIVDLQCKTKIVQGTIPDINWLPMPDRSILYKYDEFGKSKMKRFMGARYCMWSCKYCFNHIFRRLYSGKNSMLLQRRYPDLVLQEIMDVRDTYGLEVAYFNDDDFIASEEWFNIFIDSYKVHINLPYCVSIRASSATPDNLFKLSHSKCIMANIALESANEETQKAIRRGFITNGQVRFAVRYLEENGVKVRLQNMIGLPVDDPLQDALDTLAMNIELNPSDSWCAIFQPYPKTDLWKECIQKGLIDKDKEAGTFNDNTVLKIKDADKINRLHKWWYYVVKNQVPIEFVRDVLLEIPLTQEQMTLMQNTRWEIGKKLLYGL